MNKKLISKLLFILLGLNNFCATIYASAKTELNLDDAVFKILLTAQKPDLKNFIDAIFSGSNVKESLDKLEANVDPSLKDELLSPEEKQLILDTAKNNKIELLQKFDNDFNDDQKKKFEQMGGKLEEGPSTGGDSGSGGTSDEIKEALEGLFASIGGLGAVISGTIYLLYKQGYLTPDAYAEIKEASTLQKIYKVPKGLYESKKATKVKDAFTLMEQGKFKEAFDLLNQIAKLENNPEMKVFLEKNLSKELLDKLTKVGEVTKGLQYNINPENPQENLGKEFGENINFKDLLTKLTNLTKDPIFSDKERDILNKLKITVTNSEEAVIQKLEESINKSLEEKNFDQALKLLNEQNANNFSNSGKIEQWKIDIKLKQEKDESTKKRQQIKDYNSVKQNADDLIAKGDYNKARDLVAQAQKDQKITSQQATVIIEESDILDTFKEIEQQINDAVSANSKYQKWQELDKQYKQLKKFTPQKNLDLPKKSDLDYLSQEKIATIAQKIEALRTQIKGINDSTVKTKLELQLKSFEKSDGYINFKKIKAIGSAENIPDIFDGLIKSDLYKIALNYQLNDKNQKLNDATKSLNTLKDNLVKSFDKATRFIDFSESRNPSPETIKTLLEGHTTLSTLEQIDPAIALQLRSKINPTDMITQISSNKNMPVDTLIKNAGLEGKVPMVPEWSARVTASETPKVLGEF